MKPCIKYLRRINDNRGSLVSIEGSQDIPFEINRVYYLFENQLTSIRGYHAHKNLSQLAVCVSGSCKITLDDGHERKDVILNSPDVGVIIENNMWREIHEFSVGCVLLVLASERYDESDYIRDYNEFLKVINNE